MRYVKCVCINCEKQFKKNINSYNQSIKRGQKLYCSRRCYTNATKTGTVFKCYNKDCNKICYRTKNQVSKNYSGHFFCSSACAATFNNTQRITKFSLLHKFKLLLKQRLKRLYLENPSYCHICKNSIPFNRRQFKTCSSICATKTKGGYHCGSGFSKHGWYKGFWCDSTYELIFLIYCLDHNIPIKRNTEKFYYTYNNKIHYYVPDFIINNTTLIEIKGFYTDLVNVKKDAVVDKPLIILYKKDLQDEFNYVKNTYHVYEGIFNTLFDNYKPQYKYTCGFCNKIFYSYVKKRTPIVFCSRTCAGKSLHN